MNRLNLRTNILASILLILLLSIVNLVFTTQLYKTANLKNELQANAKLQSQHTELSGGNNSEFNLANTASFSSRQQTIVYLLFLSVAIILVLVWVFIVQIRKLKRADLEFLNSIKPLLKNDLSKNSSFAENVADDLQETIRQIKETYALNSKLATEIEHLKSRLANFEQNNDSTENETISEFKKTIKLLEKYNADLKEALEKSEKSELKISKLLFILPEPFTITSLETGRFVMTNDVFLKGTGFTREEVINHTSIELNVWLNPDDRKRWADELIKAGSVRNLEMPFRTKKYGIRDYLVSSEIIELDGEKCTINAYVDVTLRKIEENELRKAKEKAEESNNLKTAFIQNISHEIRTPMNAIIGFAGLLTKKQLADEKRNEFISIVQNSSRQLLSVVTDILTISSIETNQESVNNTQFNVNLLLEEIYAVFNPQAERKKIGFLISETNVNRSVFISADKGKLTQILTNLLTNALKFTHLGSIEFGYKIKYELKQPEIEFFVKDTGIGIKPEHQRTIFEHFRQAEKSIQYNYGGTGLGLAICKGFVELLGGKIWVVSKLDKGSSFYFSIPYNSVNDLDKTFLLTKQSKNFTTILVAEDEDINFLYIEELLADKAIKAIHAADGEETINIFKSNPEIDLILMDIKMPGMDGYEAAKIIKQLKPELCIIAQSAYALERERVKYENIFDDYITKPINPEEFNRKILKFINRQKIG